MSNLPINKWKNCYEDSWQDLIVPEAFSHPAKMARGLLVKILHHIKLNNWKADIILDPFGGIGSTAILGAYSNHNVVCVELEAEFYRLANSYECPGITKKEWLRWYNRFRRNPDICPNCHQTAQSWYKKHTGIIPFREPHHFVGNFEIHRKTWQTFGHPEPVMIQGDSRRLCEIVDKADIIVSSPPFQGAHSGLATDEEPRERMKDGRLPKTGMLTQSDYGSTPGQLGAMKSGNVDLVISSPPYAESLKGDGTQNETAAESRAKRRTPGGSLGQSQRTQGYGSKDNLGNLKAGDVDLVISSPPYAENKNEGHTDKRGFEYTGNHNYTGKRCSVNRYTAPITEGNLGNLKPGKVDVIVSSPPYEKSIQTDGDGIDWSKIKEGGTRKTAARAAIGTGYGKTNGQLAEEQGETFWSAAKIIVEQCYQILREGGHAIWVTKDFVRNKKRVHFSDDWQKLCEAAGFKLVCRHRAMLVKKEEYESLFGHTITKIKEYKSFFRKLAEAKGSPRIDWEDILCFEKRRPDGVMG